MPGPFAIAAVTAVLKDLLNDGMADHDLSAIGNVTVTALPPDRIPTSSAEERSQLNIFLYQVTPNAGWRNVGLPSRGSAGDRLTNPPLALDLRYLITAYGQEEFHSETLLGYAMQLLHERPVLTRDMIRATLTPTLPPEVTLPANLSLLSTSDLAENLEQITISPHYLNSEEMSRLWSAMQAKYRPTAVYHVSVILIEADKGGRAALPVLKRGEADRGPQAAAGLVVPFPTIDKITLPNNQPRAKLNDAVRIEGHHLAGESGDPGDVEVAVRLSSPRLDLPVELLIPVNARSENYLTFTVPNTPADLVAGLYSLAVLVTPNGTPDERRSSNETVLGIAPEISGGLGGPVVRTGVDPVTQLGAATIILNCSPEVRPEQRGALVLGSREVPASPHPAQTDTLEFVASNLAAGEYRVRLRVDGAESLLIDRSDPANLKFDETQKVTLS